MYARIFFLSLFLIVSTACQNEIIDIIQPSNDGVLKAGNNVTKLIQRVVTKDGSKDNIIDLANCITIQLPITVVVNGIELIIKIEKDYELIESIFNESYVDVDTLKIIFPIEIILSNYTKIEVKNDDELKIFTDECNGENEVDDDIECIDFVYPITLSVYDSANQLAKTLSIGNDEQFYKFIDNMKDFNIVQINFPIMIVLYDGTKKIINNMNTLENVIEGAKDVCDEDDDYDFDD